MTTLLRARVRLMAVVLASVSVVSLTSCQSPEATRLAGSIINGAGGMMGYHSSEASHALHAASEIVVAYSIYQSYRATQEQEEIARAQAAKAIRSPQVKRSKAKYVAVPVPKKKPTPGGPKNDLVVVDKQTGEPVNKKVYETTSSSQLSGGNVGNLGGHEAVVYNGMQGV